MHPAVLVEGNGEAARVRAALEAHGHAVLNAEGAIDAAARDPWALAARLLGEPPEMLERQPIRPVPHGRSFASTQVEAPLHTDSQMFRGAPPSVQILVCVRPAPQGGEPTLLDTWPLLDALATRDPALYGALFWVPRRIPFLFGDVYGPTVALRGGALAFTHAPIALPGDPVARRLQPWIDAARPAEIPLRAGEVLLVDNRRMLHGRRAFEDPRRELLRLLVWTPRPLPEPPAHRLAAEAAAREIDRALRNEPSPVRRRFGLGLSFRAEPSPRAAEPSPRAAEPSPRAAEPQGASRSFDGGAGRLGLVLEMLRGVPPGVLSARARVPEAELYRLRDEAMAAAAAALTERAEGGPQETRAADEALSRLTRRTQGPRW